MSSVRRIRERVRSVKNIQQITRAMKMVASARMLKAQTQLLEARPYASKLRGMIRDIAAQTVAVQHPLMQVNATPRQGLVVLTSDKGLCGGFNAQPLQAAGKYLTEAESAQHEILAVGRKAIDFFRRSGIKPANEWAGFWQELNWYHADAIADEIIAAYSAGRWSCVTLVYNRFKSMISQELVKEVLLPLPRFNQDQNTEHHLRQYEFEPSADGTFSLLLPRYIKVAVWHALLESKAAELAARMQAMENATKSAGEMIDELRLNMNRARQAAITGEISELVSSADAINA